MRQSFSSMLSLVVVSTLIFATETSAADLRTWSDASGKFKLKAELVSVDDGSVTLKGEDGKEFEIPLTKLSAADKKFLESLDSQNPFAAKSDNPFQKKAMSKDDDEPTAGGPAQIDPPVNWQDAQEIAPTPPQGDWSYKVEPITGPLADVKSFKAVAISQPDNKAGFKKAALNPVAKKFALSFFSEGQRGSGTGTNYVTLVDWDKGRAASPGKMEGEPYAIADLHNDGQRALMIRDVWGHNNNDRLEVWKIAGSRTSKLLSFVPYPESNGKNHDIGWARFLGDDRCITKVGGQIVVWQLDPLQPLMRFACDGYCHPALSPDHRYVAFAQDTYVAIIDLQEEQCVAALPIPGTGRATHPQLAFSPNGTKLGLLNWEWLYTWDLNTGNVLNELYTGNEGHNAGLLFTSNDHVMIGNQNVIDLPNNIKLWQYPPPFATWNHPLALDEWTFFPIAPGHGKPGIVVAARLPHPAALTKLEQMKDDPNLFAVKPGSAVKIDVQGVGDASKRTEIQKSLTEKLTANGCTVSDRAPLSLVATVTPGKSEKLRFFGSFDEYDFPATLSKLTFLLNGQTIWERVGSNVPGIVTRQNGESMSDALKRLQAIPNYNIYLSQQLPKFLMKPQATPANNSPGAKTSAEYLGSTQVSTAGIR
ncbi:hypothetical protein GC163_10565 [bacterium]|nr:hypothetical protein [bacterium]